MTRIVNAGRIVSGKRQQITDAWLKSIQGTWALKQINVSGDLNPAEVATAIGAADVAGFSARVPWSQITTDGVTYDMTFLNTCLAKANASSKPLVVRILGGQFCPGSGTTANQLFNSAGMNAFQSNGSGFPPLNQWIPCPFNTDGSPNTLYEGFYTTLAAQLAAWARAQGVQPGGYPQPGLPMVPMIVFPWYSYGTSEVYADATSGGAVPGGELFAATGFSTAAMDTAYSRLFAIGAAVSGKDLMVQWALSGQGGASALSRLDLVISALAAANVNAKYLSLGGTNWNGGQTSPVSPTGLMFNQPISQDLTQRFNSYVNPCATAIQAQRAGDQDWTACYRMIGSYGIDFVEIYTVAFTAGLGVPSATAANIAAMAVERTKFKGVNNGRIANAGRVAN